MELDLQPIESSQEKLDLQPVSLDLQPIENKAGLGTALKESFAGIGNTADIAGSALWAVRNRLISGTDASDEIYKNLNERIASRNQWANPDNLQTSGVNKLLAGAATLPMGMITAGLAPAEVEKGMLDAGETKLKAGLAAATSAAGNFAGLIAPAFTTFSAPAKAVFNGMTNSAQSWLTDLVVSTLADTKQAKEQFAPTWEKAVIAFGIGGFASAVQSISQMKKPSGDSKLDAIKKNDLLKTVPTDPNAEMWKARAEDMARNDQTVARLENAVARQGQPEGTNGTLYTNSEGTTMPESKVPDQYTAAGRPGLDPRAQQMALPMDEQAGTFQSPHALIGHGEGRFDENGIPINAARSMEAANLENPLQRNMWGDELPRQAPQEAPRGITRALDRLPPGEQRTEAVNQLSNGSTVPKGQRGALNMDIFNPTFKREKRLPNGVVLKFQGALDTDVPRVTAYKNGEAVGKLEFNSEFWANPGALDNVEAGWVDTHGAPKTGLAPEMYKFVSELGNDIVPSKTQTMGGRAMWKRFEADGLAQDGVIPKKWAIPKNQRGMLSIEDIKQETKDLLDKAHTIGAVGFQHLTSAEEYMSNNIPGMKESLASKIPEAPAPADIIKAGLDPKATDIDNLGLWSNVQSGMTLTAAKFRNNPVLLGLGRIGRELAMKNDYRIKELVKPIQDIFRSQITPEKIEVANLLKHEEMGGAGRHTPEELAAAGYNQRQINSYRMIRDAYDATLKFTNDAREASGRKPITAREAYIASMRQGDWQFPVLAKKGSPRMNEDGSPLMDTSGNPVLNKGNELVWFVRENTKAGAEAAIRHLKENHADSLDVDNIKIEYRKDSSKYHPDMPRDVMGAYADLQEHFSDDPVLSKTIQEGFEQFMQEKGYGTLGHKVHFLEKNNIRGFEGDKPWRSEKENANQLLQGQINYLKNAVQWAHTQEAMAKMKEVLANPELQKKMPNVMEYANQVIAQQFGESKNVMAGIEGIVARMLPAYEGNPLNYKNWAVGRSSRDIYTGVGGVKSFLYLQLLGLNTAHAIATPIQSLMTVPAQHRLLTTEGFEHNIAKTTMFALNDFTGAILSHQLHEFTGKDVQGSMSDFGYRMLKGAENTGVIEKNMFRENVDLGDSMVGAMAQRTLGSTLAFPEKITRLATFMGFAHHLKASGKFEGNEAGLIQRAAELTDHSLTSFRRTDRPMVVDKLGAAGSLSYMFKSYLFNYFNQLSLMTREASRYVKSAGKEGAFTPLLTHLASVTAVGGILSTPLLEEMDGAWNVIKDWASSDSMGAPGLYAFQVPGTKWKPFMGDGLKAAVIGHTPEIASYGAASKLTNLQLQSRLGTGFLNVEQPFRNIFPVTQDIKETETGVAALTNPNKTTLTQALYTQLPSMGKGQMETGYPALPGAIGKGLKSITAPFQNAERPEIAMNPNKLMEHESLDHLRTPMDWEKRKWGLTSLDESKNTQTRYIHNAQLGRIQKAVDSMGTRLYDSIKRGDQEDSQLWARRILDVDPRDGVLEASVEKSIKDESLTTTERNAIKLEIVNTAREARNYQRLKESRGQLK